MANVEHGGDKKQTYPHGMTCGDKSHRDECYRIRRYRHRENGGEMSEPIPGVTTWHFRCAICTATFIYEGRHEGRGGTLAQEKGWRDCHTYGWVCPCEHSRANLSFINPYSREFLDRAPTDKELQDAQPFPEPLPHWQIGTAFDGLNEIVTAFVAATDEMDEIMAAAYEIEEMHWQPEFALMRKSRTLPDDEMGSGPQVTVKQTINRVRKEFFQLLAAGGIRAARGPCTVMGCLSLHDENGCLVNVAIDLTHWRKGRLLGLKSVIPVWEHFADVGDLGIPTLRKELYRLVGDLQKLTSKVHNITLRAADFTGSS